MFDKERRPETERKIMEEEIHDVQIDATAPNSDIIQRGEYSQDIVSFMGGSYPELNIEFGLDNAFSEHLGGTGMDPVECFLIVTG